MFGVRIAMVLGLFCLLSCGTSERPGGDVVSDSDPEQAESDADLGVDTATGGDTGLPATNLPGRFAAGSMPPSLHMGGYIDSIFINASGDRIYFVHSIVSPSVLQAQATAEQCSHVQAPQLPGHVTAPGLEWNSDLYYVQWDGTIWSEPINLGAPINSLGMECCIWLNDAETEMIFYTKSDLDGDGADGDLGLPPTGNYRVTRSDRDAAWTARWHCLETTGF